MTARRNNAENVNLYITENGRSDLFCLNRVDRRRCCEDDSPAMTKA